ncbi:Gfo/Idh/MocA family oxidoreductase [Microbacterium protaetiae]|uniref:Gfo/Idh/MocA family oxidoreductase n=1 Tax=Microbacterium protaetiae TaxID=2509458 RepID=A0A4P6EGS3_9MICO|nr:Gfo/Idh/MocA family oxidoreductase [Microbacterium protaetiae]QAY59297.1 Gfo/Idh/MocA family oxidoreductase [Microbacterium protaetiae]
MMRIGLIGAGVIGRTHAQAIASTEGFELTSVADPFSSGAELATDFGATHHRDHRDLLAAGGLDAVIVATPNDLHVPVGLDVIAAGLPLLVEKPIATTSMQARVLVDAAAAARVPVLVGHHRRYHPVVRRAKEIIDSGRLGRIVGVSATAFMRKPPDYFDIAWRRERGTGGPFLINLIHEIDLLRHLIGEVTSVSAFASSAARSFEVEDTGAVIMSFDGGALGSLAISDAVAAPWSWDLTAGDSSRFPMRDVESHRIGGESASLTLPTLQLWEHDGAPSWTMPQHVIRQNVPRDDPYAAQLRHLGEVVTGDVQPLVSAAEGARDLEVVEAVMRSATTGAVIAV